MINEGTKMYIYLVLGMNKSYFMHGNTLVLTNMSLTSSNLLSF